MKNSKLKNKRRFVALAVGGAIGIMLTLTGGAVFYRMPAGQNVKSKLHYLVRKGMEHLRHKGKGTIADTPEQTLTADEGAEPAVLYLTIDADKPVRTINPLIYGSNLTSKTEFEMDVAQFGKDTGITNFRFPGGSSMGYRWQLGTYDFEGRFDEAPLAKIENVIKFCQIADARLIIQVNVESGTPQEAAEWVRHMNVNKIGGYRVDYWELGNEVYGDWDKAYMSGEEYVRVIKEYSALMKQADPAIKIGADWGGPRYQEFDKAVMQGAADNIDFVSYHWYPNHINKNHEYQGRTHPLPEEIMANALAVGEMAGRFERMVAEYAPHRRGKIEFTVMEWDGSWDAVPSDLEFAYRGMMWSLANAIFYADALGQFARHGVSVANQYAFQEVMFGLIRGWDRQAGWGGSRWDGETVRPKALALKLFSKHFGDVLVESALTGSPSYYKEADWRADSYAGEVPYVESYVSRSSGDGDRAVIIVLINKHAQEDFQTNITIKGAGTVGSEGEVWILDGPDLQAQNDGSPGAVAVTKYDLSGAQKKFSYTVPRHSVSLLKIPYQ